MTSGRASAPTRPELELETHRAALTGYCYRMLGSPFDAEDAVQETLLRAWRGLEGFERRAALRSWLYRIATNVCFDMLAGRGRRAMPMDLGGPSPPDPALLNARPEVTWIQPIPDQMLDEGADPAEVAVARETLKLAFVAALQRLPARQRAVLILCEVLRWRAGEVAELLQTSVASVNSALQRARATLQESEETGVRPAELNPEQRALLARYVDAFERYDMDALTAVLREDAIQSMPPYDLWLRGRKDILAWMFGPGIGCRGSRLLAAPAANGSVAFAQYKPDPGSEHLEPWALQVLDLADDGVAELTFFLEPSRLLALFGLPPRLPRGGQ